MNAKTIAAAVLIQYLCDNLIELIFDHWFMSFTRASDLNV